MRRHSKLGSLLAYVSSAFLILFLLSSGVACRQFSGDRTADVKLKRGDPDGWFGLLLPTRAGEVKRYADVDGGSYQIDELEISYDYWTYENTPNFLRNTKGHYSRGPIRACSGNAKHTRNSWTRVAGRRALLQSCSRADERRGFHYVYHLSFPGVGVYDGEKMRSGVFNLTITYKDERYRSLARRIARSINF